MNELIRFKLAGSRVIMQMLPAFGGGDRKWPCVEHLLHARHQARCLTYILPFHSLNNYHRRIIIHTWCPRWGLAPYDMVSRRHSQDSYQHQTERCLTPKFVWAIWEIQVSGVVYLVIKSVGRMNEQIGYQKPNKNKVRNDLVKLPGEQSASPL